MSRVLKREAARRDLIQQWVWYAENARSPKRSQRLQHLARPHHPRILALEIRQTHGMHLGRRPPSPVPIPTSEREARVLHYERLEPQIPRHPHRGLHRIIGDHPGHHQRLHPARPQPRFQIRADERAVGLLANHRFPRLRHRLRLELVPLLPRSIMRLRLPGIVPHMVDRPSARPPRARERGDISFRPRIVALAPTGVVDRPLHIDHYQRRRWGKPDEQPAVHSAVPPGGCRKAPCRPAQDQPPPPRPPRPPRRAGCLVGSSPVNVSVTSAVCRWASTLRSALVAPKPSNSPSSLIRFRK